MKYYALKDKNTGKYKQKGKSYSQANIPALYTYKVALNVQKRKNKELQYTHTQPPIFLYNYEIIEINLED